jgi:hypothetical protein
VSVLDAFGRPGEDPLSDGGNWATYTNILATAMEIAPRARPPPAGRARPVLCGAWLSTRPGVLHHHRGHLGGERCHPPLPVHDRPLILRRVQRQVRRGIRGAGQQCHPHRHGGAGGAGGRINTSGTASNGSNGAFGQAARTSGGSGGNAAVGANGGSIAINTLPTVVAAAVVVRPTPRAMATRAAMAATTERAAAVRPSTGQSQALADWPPMASSS